MYGPFFFVLDTGTYFCLFAWWPLKRICPDPLMCAFSLSAMYVTLHTSYHCPLSVYFLNCKDLVARLKSVLAVVWNIPCDCQEFTFKNMPSSICNTTPAHPQELAVAEFTYLRSVLYMKTFWFCFYFFYIYTCIYGNLICIDIIVVLENWSLSFQTCFFVQWITCMCRLWPIRSHKHTFMIQKQNTFLH